MVAHDFGSRKHGTTQKGQVKRMWSIAICDDNRRVCYKMEELLEAYCEEMEIALETEIFPDGFRLYEEMTRGSHYDLIFLDVIMFGMNGIEVGRQIRRTFDGVQLVYMTCITGHADLMIPNQPIGFVRKPIQKEEVYRAMDDARKIGKQNRTWFLYKKHRMTYQVSYREILYFQSLGRKVEIHTSDGVNEFYGKLSSLMEEGLPKQFVQIHQSYIINRDYISCFGNGRVYLRGHKGYFNVSQPYRQAATQQIGSSPMSDFVK